MGLEQDREEELLEEGSIVGLGENGDYTGRCLM